MPGLNLLIVEDEIPFFDVLDNLLKNDFNCIHATTVDKALGCLLKEQVDAVLLDIDLGAGQTRGLELLRHLKSLGRQLPVIVVTKIVDDIATIVEAMRLGAHDYIGKTPVVNELLSKLNQALRQVKQIEDYRSFSLTNYCDDWILKGSSEPASVLRDDIRRAANTDGPLMIIGEPGSMAESIARIIHRDGKWSSFRFLVYNSRQPHKTERLLEQIRHSLRNAEERTPQIPDSGCMLFIHEINEIESSQQRRIIELAQRRAPASSGSVDAVNWIRVIATRSSALDVIGNRNYLHHSLEECFHDSRLHIPPLIRRKEDLYDLAHEFVVGLAKRYGTRFSNFDHDAMTALKEYDWPENTMELASVLQNAFMNSGNDIIKWDDLPLHVKHYRPQVNYHTAKQNALKNFQSRFWSMIDTRLGVNVSQTARVTHVSREARRKIFSKFGLSDRKEQSLEQDEETNK